MILSTEMAFSPPGDFTIATLSSHLSTLIGPSYLWANVLLYVPGFIKTHSTFSRSGIGLPWILLLFEFHTIFLIGAMWCGGVEKASPGPLMLALNILSAGVYPSFSGVVLSAQIMRGKRCFHPSTLFSVVLKALLRSVCHLSTSPFDCGW